MISVSLQIAIIARYICVCRKLSEILSDCPFIASYNCTCLFALCPGFSYIDDVSLTTAVWHDVSSSDERQLAVNVEQCRCPDGYTGQFCEACDYGYHRDRARGGPHARCVMCTCHGHSDTCDVDTGQSLTNWPSRFSVYSIWYL